MINDIKWALFHVPKSEVIFVAESKKFIKDILETNSIYIQNGVYFYVDKEDAAKDPNSEIVELDVVEFDIIKIKVMQSTDTVFSYKILKT